MPVKEFQMLQDILDWERLFSRKLHNFISLWKQRAKTSEKPHWENSWNCGVTDCITALEEELRKEGFDL